MSGADPGSPPSTALSTTPPSTAANATPPSTTPPTTLSTTPPSTALSTTPPSTALSLSKGRKPHHRPGRRGWWWVVVVAVALGLLSLASNLTSTAQLSGQADTLLATRLTASKVVNAGTLWAGLGVLSGWLVTGRGGPTSRLTAGRGRRTSRLVAGVSAAVAGVSGGLLALVVHYAAGQAIGHYGPDIWVENTLWFVAAVVTGAPLGLVGAVAGRPDRWGLLARLVVPVAAMVEPWLGGAFTPVAITPWPGRVSSLVSGALLVLGGVVGVVVVLTRHRRRH